MSTIVATGFDVVEIWAYPTSDNDEQDKSDGLEMPVNVTKQLNSRTLIPRVSNNGRYINNWQQCPHCSYKSRYHGNLKSHVKTMHSHDRQRRGKFEQYHFYQCALCPYGSKNKQALQNHMVARHCESNHSECPRCHIMLKNQLCVRSHLQYCGKAAVHQCCHCSFKTRYRNHLSRHFTNVHTKSNTIECPNQCGSVLKNKESLRQHLNFCGTELFSVQCRYCSFRPKRRNLLKLHMLRVHADLDNLTNQCPKCTKKFKKKAYLKKHVPHCDSKKVFQCATCSYTIHKKDLLVRHIIHKHLNSDDEEEKTIQYIPCPRCGIGFKNQTILSEHLVRCGDVASFHCYHCPFKAKIKDHLKNHILCAHIESNEFYQINMRNYLPDQAPFHLKP